MSASRIREVLLHGDAGEAFDRSMIFARRFAEAFGARLHVVYTLEDPLSGGWTAEMATERLPEVHQAIEREARERLARVISFEDQERLGVDLVIRIGPAESEVVKYSAEHPIDLAIVHAPAGEPPSAVARALLEHGRCAVLVLR